MNPFVSIIVPCRTVDDFTKECVTACKALDYDRFEIILLSDSPGEVEGGKVIVTGPVTPGKKRNIGGQNAGGEVLAFIDADAYPDKDWISRGVAHLTSEGVGAVGGPGLTPPSDDDFSHAQGAILSSFLVGGISSRYRGSHDIETDDIHSVNLLVRRDLIESIGGWNEDYYPGEDTLLCLAIGRSGHKLVLAHDVIVYHHRRRTWGGYLRQVWGFGVHRGFFAKKFPKNSRKVGYFIPSIMVSGLVALGILSPFSLMAEIALSISIVAYLSMDLLVTLQNRRYAASVFFGIPLTHITYGIGFLRGLASSKLSR
jgi:GT2 family glycosyltransferase